MSLDQIPFREISSAAILLPLILAGLKFKTGDLKVRLFFLFLLFGAVTDGTGWLVYRVLDPKVFGIYHHFLQFSYLLFEYLLLTWLCSEFLKFKKTPEIRKVLYGIILVLFMIRGWFTFFVELEPFRPPVFSSVSGAICLVIISFLSAFALLHLAEEKGDSLMGDPWFWILSGIFFYSFGTFFIDLLASTKIVDEVWRLRNLVNVIQYGFFVVGLVRIRKDQ